NSGIDLLVGDNMIGTSSVVGYTGPISGPGFTPRFFLGSVTIAPAVQCAGKPDASFIKDSTACPNMNTILELDNPPIGVGYTFELILGANNPTRTINYNQPTYYY